MTHDDAYPPTSHMAMQDPRRDAAPVEIRTAVLAAIRAADNALGDLGECGRRDEQDAVVDTVMAVIAPVVERAETSFSLSYLAQRNIVAAELEICEARLAEVTAERDRLAAQLSKAESALAEVPSPNAAFARQAEIARMRPVVEAAVARRGPFNDPLDEAKAKIAYAAAVDAYRSTLGQDGAVRPPQEAQNGPGAAGGTSSHPGPTFTEGHPFQRYTWNPALCGYTDGDGEMCGWTVDAHGGGA